MPLRRIPRARDGFTLIELLIVISIISLLLAILLPALSAARESGLETKCRANLKTFGQGVMTYAQANDEFLCSGAFDPQVSNKRDGPVDRVGWVADQVNSKASFPGQMLCPSNVAIYNQKLGPDGATYSTNSAKELVRRGYNTNYTQSWYMGRTEFKPGGTGNLKSITGTFWALHTSFLRSVDSSRIPLLGDGRTDPGSWVLGQRCVKSMGDGPYGDIYGPQDYRDFGPAHGRGSWLGKGHDRIRANMLFADGHVGYFKDQDRDGEFALDDSSADQPRQKDLGGEVFDGVLTLGRRSRTATTME